MHEGNSLAVKIQPWRVNIFHITFRGVESVANLCSLLGELQQKCSCSLPREAPGPSASHIFNFRSPTLVSQQANMENVYVHNLQISCHIRLETNNDSYQISDHPEARLSYSHF